MTRVHLNRIGLIILSTLVGLELLARVLYLREASGSILALPVAVSALLVREQTIDGDGPLVRPDPVVGYSFIPGVHKLEMKKGALRRGFTVTIDETGHRATSPVSNALDARPELWLLGCSYTWGYLVNDEETFAWMLQASLPQFHVRNFGANGFGTIHSLLQLKAAIEAKRKPAIAVIFFNTFHMGRNTISKAAIGAFRAQPNVFSWLTYPMTRVEQGGVSARLVNVFSDEAREARELTEAEQVQLTVAIFIEIRRICLEAGIDAVLAVQSGDLDASPLREARQSGWAIIDARVNLTEAGGRRFTFAPLDGHPNVLAHRRYAELVEAGLGNRLHRGAQEVDLTWPDSALSVQYSLQLDNPGKAAANLALRATMNDPLVTVDVQPEAVPLPPGAGVKVQLTFRGTRPKAGSYTGYVEVDSGALQKTRIPIRLEVPGR